MLIVKSKVHYSLSSIKIKNNKIFFTNNNLLKDNLLLLISRPPEKLFKTINSLYHQPSPIIVLLNDTELHVELHALVSVEELELFRGVESD